MKKNRILNYGSLIAILLAIMIFFIYQGCRKNVDEIGFAETEEVYFRHIAKNFSGCIIFESDTMQEAISVIRNAFYKNTLICDTLSEILEPYINYEGQVVFSKEEYVSLQNNYNELKDGFSLLSNEFSMDSSTIHEGFTILKSAFNDLSLDYRTLGFDSLPDVFEKSSLLCDDILSYSNDTLQFWNLIDTLFYYTSNFRNFHLSDVYKEVLNEYGNKSNNTNRGININCGFVVSERIRLIRYFNPVVFKDWEIYATGADWNFIVRCCWVRVVMWLKVTHEVTLNYYKCKPNGAIITVYSDWKFISKETVEIDQTHWIWDCFIPPTDVPFKYPLSTIEVLSSVTEYLCCPSNNSQKNSSSCVKCEDCQCVEDPGCHDGGDGGK